MGGGGDGGWPTLILLSAKVQIFSLGLQTLDVQIFALGLHT